MTAMAKARSQELHQGLPRGWQGPRRLDHHSASQGACAQGAGARHQGILTATARDWARPHPDARSPIGVSSRGDKSQDLLPPGCISAKLGCKWSSRDSNRDGGVPCGGSNPASAPRIRLWPSGTATLPFPSLAPGLHPWSLPRSREGGREPDPAAGLPGRGVGRRVLNPGPNPRLPCSPRAPVIYANICK